MRKLLYTGAVIILLASCKKDNTVIAPPPTPAHPQMIYTDLKEAEVKYGKLKLLDIDGDGSYDFRFSVCLVGDPVLQRDRYQFYVSSTIDRNLLNNEADESPVLSTGDSISKIHPGYQWWEISVIVLAEKIVTNTGNYWQGLWKDASHKYLPVQVEKNQQVFHGWVELSFDTVAEKMILHKAALSKEADKAVKAGY